MSKKRTEVLSRRKTCLNDNKECQAMTQKPPDNEAPRQVKVEKNQYLCGFRDFLNRINLPLYTKFTPIGAENGAETKKSHNFEFHTAPEKLRLFRSFFHFS